MSIPTIELETWYRPPDNKPWAEKSRDEKLVDYDAMLHAFRGIAEELQRDINTLMAQGGCTLRCTVILKIDVDPNDDPRLPCTHSHYDFRKHGRYCDCGTLMTDPGD